ncbi:MAG: hypothetical protein M3333_07440 [Actinomycetota bacterium]|nr:hypothetical protein [Actinomycetota bacterium]
MDRYLAALVLVVGATVGVSCAGSGTELSESGSGLPQVTVAFPPSAEPGSVQRAQLEVVNPGPGDIGTLIVAFTRAGDPDLPTPIVDVTGGRAPSAVRSVDPAPAGVSSDGVVYRFSAASAQEPFLPEGESTGITFSLLVPKEPGSAANAVQVYDGSEIDRAAGVRLETDVEG